MNIWVDADACPVPIKEVIFRAAIRTKISTIFVANHDIRVPKENNILFRRVERGFDIADDFIGTSIVAGDLVITNDIPLAAKCIEDGCLAITTNGELLTRENIGERLNIRDFMDTMRASGIQQGGPRPFGKKDIKAFSDALDRQITKFLNQ